MKTEVIKLLCTLESPAGLVKMQIAGSPPPEFLIQEFWWGTEQEEFVFLNNTQVIMILLVWGGRHLENSCSKTQRPRENIKVQIIVYSTALVTTNSCVFEWT